MCDLPPSEAVLSFLRDVQRQLVAAGAMPGQDFVVNWVTDEVASGDNHGLRPTGGGFEVYYNERGDRRVLLSTADADQARSCFAAAVLGR